MTSVRETGAERTSSASNDAPSRPAPSTGNETIMAPGLRRRRPTLSRAPILGDTESPTDSSYSTSDSGDDWLPQRERAGQPSDDHGQRPQSRGGLARPRTPQYPCPEPRCPFASSSMAHVGRHWGREHPTIMPPADVWGALELRRNKCGLAVPRTQADSACQCGPCTTAKPKCPVCDTRLDLRSSQVRHFSRHSAAQVRAVPPAVLRTLGVGQRACGKICEVNSLNHPHAISRCLDPVLCGSGLTHAQTLAVRRNRAADDLTGLDDVFAQLRNSPSEFFGAASIHTLVRFVDAVLAMQVRTWKRVPQRLSATVALELAAMLEDLARAPSELEQVRALSRLWTFPTLVLCLPPGRQPSRARAAFLVDRLHKWRADSITELVSAVPVDAALPTGTLTPDLLAKQVQKHMRAHHIGAAARLLESSGIHQVTDDVLAKLRALHPSAADTSSQRQDAHGPGQDSTSAADVPWEGDDIRQLILAIPHTSGSGPSRWSASLLHQALQTEVAGSKVQVALLRVSQALVRRGFEGQAGALWNHARLIPLRKKDGGVRPIAVGEVLRRALGKLALRCLGQAAVDSLLPLQFGVGRKSGLEAAIMGTRMAVLEPTQSEPVAALKIDLANAFNTVSRHTLLRLVHARFPELWPLVRSTYSTPSPLRLGTQMLYSARGVQQGDPLGPLLFSLVLQNVLAQFSAPQVHQVWYLDDGCVVGTPAHLAAFLLAFEHDAQAHGLAINRAKTEFILTGTMTRSDVPDGLQDLLVTSWSEAELLGVPLDATGAGRALAPIARLSRKVLDLARTVSELPCSEEAFHLLRGSVGPRRLAHLTRTMPADVIRAELASFDEGWRHCVARTVGTAPADCLDGTDVRPEWRLPLSMGGLGLTALTDVAPFAFAAGSRAAARALDQVPDDVVPPTLVRWDARFHSDQAALACLPAPVAADDAPPGTLLSSQTQSCRRFFRKMQTDWLSDQGTTTWEFHRRHGISAPFALAWLSMPSATPLAGHATRMRPHVWQAAVRHMLGLPTRLAQFASQTRCPAISATTGAICGERLDALGRHALACVFGPSRYGRHERVAEALRDFAHAAGLVTVREPAVCDTSTARRPYDVLIGTTGVDVSVVLPDKAGARRTPGSAIRIKTAAKLSAYTSLVSARPGPPAVSATAHSAAVAPTSFCPLVLDIFGRLGDDARPFLASLAGSFQMAKQLRRGQASMILHRALSLAVFRSAAEAVLLRHSAPAIPVAGLQWLSSGLRSLAPTPCLSTLATAPGQW
ncbi:Retrotransposable element [Porphyridium purpureum]|uniref:Retrotransposable element n=1 Tax=Porphyridium purpureum TaxID=35688 RepID=A0A5J4YT27_PORPP|nr:Retrotransposable element [Porphyridium purpureum]|eukprot:POR2314..scf229_5